MAQDQKLWDPWKMYDVTPEELRAIKERAKMRQALKAEWMKKSTNPFRSIQSDGYIFDPAVQRFLSMKATQAQRFKGTTKTSFIGLLVWLLPIAVASYVAVKTGASRESKFRNGEITYRERSKKTI